MNFKKKELEEYIKEKQLKHCYLDVRLGEDSLNDENEKICAENSKIFDEMIEEKNSLIEELKCCLEMMQSKYNEEVTKYSKEVFIFLFISNK